MTDSEIISLMEDLSVIGLSQTPLDKRLKIYKSIEENHPGCHIGGSIGLFLHGIDLGRTFVDSDIDICSFRPHGTGFKDLRKGYSEIDLRSSTDMDEISYRSEISEEGISKKIKIEYKYDKTQDFDHIKHKGVTYRVTKLEIILGWKVLFACRGSKKNQTDLDKLGIRYIKGPTPCPFLGKFQTWGELHKVLEKEDLMEKICNFLPYRGKN